MEASLLVKNKTNVTLSPQQITSCNINNVNQGCNGGDPMWGYMYGNQNSVTTLSNYPFTSSNGITVTNFGK